MWRPEPGLLQPRTCANSGRAPPDPQRRPALDPISFHWSGVGTPRPGPAPPGSARAERLGPAGTTFRGPPAPRPSSSRGGTLRAERRRQDTRCRAAYKSLLVRRHLKPSFGGGRVSLCPVQPAARGGGDGARWEPSRQCRRPRPSGRPRGSSARPRGYLKLSAQLL